ncbi:poly polymerase, catalytic region domain-containing protein [Dictyostelium discoideum AX4]|uniref:Probable poly [ADP-ribose] polymerase DDB_G0278045 n=1 Tax=Dictyostelium discoideum TaxID=44689 RepID=Y8045_DICDI|nr:poly polymerase, catalytic region domain-containing protein [Dictyostelium discoideum AX4]Q54YW4.3 RecName: Full=Probable poly [ADP-ribose] polymerase DDB_G0278045 [Dictyostelium discoideum]EEU04115.1 poly polymerase, catalytic region domain-containing protein [Dictyostelium discoideum AX4]|eukprot:XP_002649167.1 poly polymerase, catalytic region domain-containing protein [Dictyostelium discoideum AX4]
MGRVKMSETFSYWIEDNIYPKKWDIIYKQRENQVFLIKINKGSSEYIIVSERFNETMSNSFEIIKIERIQNKSLWRNFDESRKRLNEKYQVSNLDFLESTLFHGTRANDPKLIFSSKVGFDIGKSSFGNYGIGLYFALNASYSNNYSFEESPTSGCKQMFLCRVLLGNSAPPTQKELKNDSTQDSIKGPGGEMFILKSNHTAYPDYLISYRQKVIVNNNTNNNNKNKNKNNNKNNNKNIKIQNENKNENKIENKNENENQFDNYGFNTNFSQNLYDKYGLKYPSQEKPKPGFFTPNKELEYEIFPLLFEKNEKEEELEELEDYQLALLLSTSSLGSK